MKTTPSAPPRHPLLRSASKLPTLRLWPVLLAATLAAGAFFHPARAAKDKGLSADDAAKHLIEAFINYVGDRDKLADMKTDAERLNYILTQGGKRVVDATQDQIQSAGEDYLLKMAEAQLRSALFQEKLGLLWSQVHIMDQDISQVWRSIDVDLKSQVDTHMRQIKAGVKAGKSAYKVYSAYQKGENRQDALQKAGGTLAREAGGHAIDYLVPGRKYVELAIKLTEALGTYIIQSATRLAQDAQLRIMFGPPEEMARQLMSMTPEAIRARVERDYEDGASEFGTYGVNKDDKDRPWEFHSREGSRDAMIERITSELVQLRGQLVLEKVRLERETRQMQEEADRLADYARLAEEEFARQAEDFQTLFEEEERLLAMIREFQLQQPDVDLPEGQLGRILDASGATLIRANLEQDALSADGLGEQAGTAPVMQGSGSWAAAAEGWQMDRGAKDEPIARNDPVRLGPFAVAPGKYAAHIRFSPPNTPSMRAGNWNTTMSIQFAAAGSPPTAATAVANVPAPADGTTTEGRQEFTLRQAGLIWVTFGPAGNQGPSGAWRHIEQSYSGQVDLLERLTEESAVQDAGVFPGDRVRAGGQITAIELFDGTTVLLQPNAEISVDRTADGQGIRITRERGQVRITRWGSARRQIECVSGGRVIRPRGTDFILSDAGVDVISGQVEISGDGEPAIVRAGEKLTYRSGLVETFDAAAAGPVVASDGIPVHADYWSPVPEPFGEKPFRLGSGTEPGGWWLADPPARRGARAEIAIPAPDTLRVAVLPESRMDCGHYAADTSARLLHKATGDFDLEAQVRIEGEPGYQASLDFLVRAPGAYPGLAAGRSPGQWGSKFTRSQGVGRSYWIPGSALAMLGKIPRLPQLNVPHRTWPVAGDAPVNIRFRRRDRVWTSAWSRDGDIWHAGGLHVADQPETLWVGWSLENSAFGRAPNPVAFTFHNVRLLTAPIGSMAREWLSLAQNGTVRADGATVRLSLDGAGPGAARAVSPGCADGDFDIVVRAQIQSPPPPEGDPIRAWSVAVAGPQDQALGVIGEIRERGSRLGLLRDESEGYTPPVRADHWIPDRHLGEDFDAQSLDLRIVRQDGAVTFHVRSGDEWKPARPDQSPRRLDGPLFFRVEIRNGDDKANLHPPMDAVFEILDSENESTQRFLSTDLPPATAPPSAG